MKCRNFLASLIAVTVAAANTEFSVAHGLMNEDGTGIVPRAWKVIRRNQACSTYESGTAFTTSLAFLKCDTANAQLYIMFFA